MDPTGDLSSEYESPTSDRSSLTPEVIPINPRSDAKGKVTFKEAGRPPLNRDQNLLTRLAAQRLKGKFQHAGRPSSVSYYNGLDKNEDDDEVTNGIRNLTLRSKSVSPAFARRSSTPLQIKRSQTPTVHIPPRGQHGMGKIFLQMPDIVKPGLTRTLSLSYSTSALNHNSRLLAEDVDTKPQRRERAQSSLVKRIETRLETLKKKKEAFLQAKEEEERKLKEEEENFLAVKSTDKLLDKKKSEKCMTGAERKQVRKERIHVRTSLMHYRTANYLRRFDEKHIKKLKSQVRYSRTVELKSKD